MSLAQDIDTAVRAAVAANEADNFDLAAKKMRSAVTLMMGHPKIRIEEDETEYVRDDLVRMLETYERLSKEQRKQSGSVSAGGFAAIPIRTRNA
jgi:signal recognition particle receptor subunit beta